jgi:predicted esterase
MRVPKALAHALLLPLLACGAGGATTPGVVATPSTSANPAPSCAAWANQQRGSGVPPAIGSVVSQRQALYDAGGGIRAVDGKYYAAYFPSGFGTGRRRVLVALHGTGGSPEAEWNDWRSTMQSRGWGFLGLKYVDDSNGSYDDDATIYSHAKTMLDEVRAACDLGGAAAFLLGFSRGSAQAFPVAYRDLKDRRLFSAVANNSGAWLLGGPLPPTLAESDARGEPSAFAGGRFWMYCGGRDMEHGYPMCDEMQNARAYVLSHGGTVERLYEDPSGGHGGLPRNPDAVAALFAYFESLP